MSRERKLSTDLSTALPTQVSPELPPELFLQVSVVAGLEALRDAGIVTGEGEGGWMLPGQMRDTTGVMYASSYPALDAAIGEVRVDSFGWVGLGWGGWGWVGLGRCHGGYVRVQLPGSRRRHRRGAC